MQSTFHVKYPQFTQERISRIDSYETGLVPHRPVDAVSGARVYEIDVELELKYGGWVRLTLNNESGHYRLIKHQMLSERSDRPSPKAH